MAAEERRRVREHGGRPDDWDRPSTEELALEAADEEAADAEADELEVGRFQALLQDRRKIFSGVLLVLLLVVGIYVLFPKIVGADEAVSNLDEAKWYWILIAVGFNVLAFGAYVALFRGILGASSQPPEPAGSCSRTGRCARRACRAGAPPAGWSRSSS
jgi:hypothetical protein